MNTQQAIQAALQLKQDHMLRSRLEKVRGEVQTTIAQLQQQIEKIDQALAVQYTGEFILLKREAGGWKCLACADGNNLPDDLPEDFDLCLPIPEPDSLPEWEGW